MNVCLATKNQILSKTDSFCILCSVKLISYEKNNLDQDVSDINDCIIFVDFQIDFNQSR